MSDTAGSSSPGPGPDAVEQVQRAVLTLIGAARVMLDAFEHLVADRSRLDDFAASGRDLVNSIVATVFHPEPPPGEPDSSPDA
jgi:hypothetical protein